ncbi:hypothetical protein VDR81_14515 [Xanthomonas campestris pv. campestris]|uniref:hypothetical protein n=1 Tax=Xanthomonas arboricola TaxID=56448 RepID=UPI000AEA3F0B|nr:hypothetical protein [Xanthomonas arboricola]MEB1100763.1 hypothetical protein [Xanthomonas campestris pv. campestris]MEB1940263.1 hypothetical protein [Xanthomonas campestris pv. campestris]MEB2038341.1 hypothetical protein [Xanthomonas campestris pv. campestris]MEB2060024.1 hypothetical protein [Xanthomonas campestris pv. campestris]
MKATEGVDWDAWIPATKEWTRRTAPMVLAIVLDRLKNNLGPISYGALALEVFRRFGEPVQPNKQKYGHPLGSSAEVAIEIGKQHGMNVPALSIIVVREDIGYAGTGADSFVKRLSGRGLDLKDPVRLELLDAEAERVRNFGVEQWEKLERLLGLLPLPSQRRTEEDLGLPSKVGRYGGGESKKHKALKCWVAKNPGKFKEFGNYVEGGVEEFLQSGDSVDVMLVGPSSRLAVEVKASNASQEELKRGIFQCVKYRATLEAEARVYPQDFLPGSCVLVSTKKLSAKNQAIADLMSVPFFQAASSCEKPL